MSDLTLAGRFAGRVAIVTGGAAGIGLEIAARITREGERLGPRHRKARCGTCGKRGGP
jgi:NAD(P)-dependent dehydrogenase (short-subunit alcohol dehydrogenase family)